MKEETKSIVNKHQRRSYFIRRTLSLFLYLFILSLPSINIHFFSSQFNKNEVTILMALFGVLLLIWISYLDKEKLALGITEGVFPKRRITIEKTSDVSENIRRYKKAEQEEIARVIEEKKDSTFINRFWKRLNI